MERPGSYRNCGGGMQLVMLSGGVGGARHARGLQALGSEELTVIVNVGDDARIYGLLVSPDLDTVVYTMAGREGPHGWGLDGDAFVTMGAMDALPIDTAFRIGDGDLATNLFRTDRIGAGWSLTWVTTAVASAFGVRATILPATDDSLRTEIKLSDGEWISFQEYFVHRQHADEVADIRFVGASVSSPSPGVIEAIDAADAVLIGPSNPILSIWPILAVPGVSEAIAGKPMVMAVSPLIGGAALKGPADRLLTSFGYGANTSGLVASYGGLLTDLLIDPIDGADASRPGRPRIHVADTRMPDLAGSTRVGQTLVEIVAGSRA
ncbi:MAG: 2-phospho-L-lactate transferase [Actinomycetota bacterium]